MRDAGAVFLDRDGTIIADPGFLHRPDDVRLLPKAREGLQALARNGWRLIVISNQSGIARGYYEAAAFYATMDRLHSQLEPSGIRLLAAYFCPHYPDVTGPCECRKPGPRLFERAAADFDVDLSASWYVGDRMRDAEPARRFGGQGLVVTGDSLEVRRARDEGVAVAHDLLAASRIIGTSGT